MSSEEITKDIMVAWLSNLELMKGSSALLGKEPQETGDYIATVYRPSSSRWKKQTGKRLHKGVRLGVRTNDIAVRPLVS
jgi:hypothetical protein